MKLAAPLTSVDRVLCGNRTTPKNALYVCSAGGVVVLALGVAWVGLRISLEIDVDGVAAIDLVALIGTGLGVVRSERGKSKITFILSVTA